MKKPAEKVRSQKDENKQFARSVTIIIAVICLGVFLFLRVFGDYNDRLLYAERLNQMQEVTEQLFNGLEDVITTQWKTARIQCNSIELAQPDTVEDLTALLKQQISVSEMDERFNRILAVDSNSRYYTQEGSMGKLAGAGYLLEKPERVSYVNNTLTGTETRMVFLQELTEPISIRDGEKEVQLIYAGIAIDMKELNPYFNCEAYDGNNCVYVIDSDGMKLFRSSGGEELIRGHNTFSVLREMKYLHGSSFDDTLKTLEANNTVYSNAILNDKEYYYALYHLDNSEWTLLFMVDSDYVATNTVALVNSTTRVILVFAVIMLAACSLLIFWMLKRQQKAALDIERSNNETLERLNTQLQAASKAKTDFLANMSHDIRTPMNAIVGITRLMAHDKQDPVKMEGYIEKVQQSSQHLLSLINDVLDMSKIESGEVTLNKEPISLADQIAQVESIVRPQIEERQQRFTIRAHNITHEHLTGDAVRLRQVFINLLSNAIKYTPHGGSIALDLEELPCGKPDCARLRLSVTDSGYGMTPEFMVHIFEPFTRAENSTTNRVQGTGLGMAITKNIVDLAGGTISVESEVDKGSCFTVELPLLIDRSVNTELPIHTALLITDEKAFLGNVQAAFKETDVLLRTAKSEEEADRLLREEPVDIVLLGSRLNGDTLAENVHRLRKETGNALLLYCCEYEEREQLARIAENGGVDGVLTRPFFLSNLARAIERMHSEVPAEVPEDVSVLNGMRFLCAEDNALNAEILQAVLDMNGASCVIYPDGQKIVDAFAAVKPGDFDAILMDVQMPVMNGLDATREIRRSENPLGKTIPIIAMTANAFSEDVQNCLNAGMDAHVSKPLDVAALERTVKSIAGGKFSGGGTTVRLSETK